MHLPNFNIKPNGPISIEFLNHNIVTFSEATLFINNLRYARNTDKTNLTTIFKDSCGTCSTKHAILKQLADENDFREIQLMLGIFKMNASNTKEIKSTLEKYHLDYIPEAHNYLKYKNQIFDFTKKGSKPSDFQNDLLQEIEITPNQITEFKIDFHKKHLQNWLTQNNNCNLNLHQLWKIREECILNLSST